MPITKEDCKKCVPTWNIKEVILILGRELPALGGIRSAVPVDLYWSACLDKLTCMPRLSRPPKSAVKLKDFSPGAVTRGTVGQTWYSDMGKGMKYIGQGVPWSGRPPAPGEQLVCCKEGREVGGNVFPNLDCCSGKREIICKCYASHPSAPPSFTTKECCIPQIREHILRLTNYQADGLAGDLILEAQTKQINSYKTKAPFADWDSIEETLANELDKIGNLGAGPQSCTGTPDSEGREVFNPVESSHYPDWVEKCKCRPTGIELPLHRCPEI